MHAEHVHWPAGPSGGCRGLLIIEVAESGHNLPLGHKLMSYVFLAIGACRCSSPFTPWLLCIKKEAAVKSF